jgi:excisionase family DNA binding protein
MSGAVNFNHTPRLAYSLAEAAKTVSLSVRSLRYLMRTGKLGYVRLGRRVLIRHEDLERLLRQGYCRASNRLDADELIRPQNRTAPEGATPSAASAVAGCDNERCSRPGERPHDNELKPRCQCTPPHVLPSSDSASAAKAISPDRPTIDAGAAAQGPPG